MRPFWRKGMVDAAYYVWSSSFIGNYMAQLTTIVTASDSHFVRFSVRRIIDLLQFRCAHTMRNDGHDSEFFLVFFFFFRRLVAISNNNNESLVGSWNEISFSELSSTQCGGVECDDDIDSQCEFIFQCAWCVPFGHYFIVQRFHGRNLGSFFLFSLLFFPLFLANQVIVIEWWTTPEVSVSAR